MKILSALFALAILVPVVAFALSNPQSCDVGLWPIAGTWTVPLYVVGLLPLFVGLIIGGLWGWAGSVPHRLRARRLHKERDALNNQIGELQKSATIQQSQTSVKRPFWERMK